MGFVEQGKFCTVCGRQTLHRQQRPTHVLHFLIAFFTCGAWLIVWALLAMSQSPWLCTICGTKYGTGAPTSQPASPTTDPQVSTTSLTSADVKAFAGGFSPKGVALLAGAAAVAFFGLFALGKIASILDPPKPQATPLPAPVSARPPAPSAAPPVVKPRGTTAPSGNETHDLLINQTDAERNQTLSVFMRQSKENCDFVERTYFQGFDKSRSAFWNAACHNGRSFAVMVYNNATGSTKILDCSVLKAIAGVECFKKF